MHSCTSAGAHIIYADFICLKKVEVRKKPSEKMKEKT